MSFGKVDENAVYQCTGQPHPNDISQIVQWMLNEDFTTAYQSKQTLAATKCTCSYVNDLWVAKAMSLHLTAGCKNCMVLYTFCVGLAVVIPASVHLFLHNILIVVEECCKIH